MLNEKALSTYKEQEQTVAIALTDATANWEFECILLTNEP